MEQTKTVGPIEGWGQSSSSLPPSSSSSSWSWLVVCLFRLMFSGRCNYNFNIQDGTWGWANRIIYIESIRGEEKGRENRWTGSGCCNNTDDHWSLVCNSLTVGDREREWPMLLAIVYIILCMSVCVCDLLWTNLPGSLLIHPLFASLHYCPEAWQVTCVVNSITSWTQKVQSPPPLRVHNEVL